MIDYCKAERNKILYLFPNIEIVPCFLHFMVYLVKHLKELNKK